MKSTYENCYSLVPGLNLVIDLGATSARVSLKTGNASEVVIELEPAPTGDGGSDG